MPTKDNKAKDQRIIEEVFNKGDMSVIPDLVAPSCVVHMAGAEYKGQEGFREFATLWRTAFPDLRLTTEDRIAEGNRVVNRWTARGTHKGNLMGIPATGKKTTNTGIMFSRWARGKAVEAWGEANMLGLMQQLGVVPPPGR